MSKQKAISQLNELGKQRAPFFFYTDFLGQQCWVRKLGEIQGDLRFSFPSNRDSNLKTAAQGPITKRHPISRKEFQNQFDKVIAEINYGNSFLVNLTAESRIESESGLNEIYEMSSAKYKLLVPDQFVVFSPETFITIAGNEIVSRPMKGTIDADIENAEEVVIKDPKELAEHITIVDLIRNDLSQIADEIEVSKFRYIEHLKTSDKNLLQVSSEIKGRLPADWQSEIGTLLYQLLPAGSISGAPKPKTVEIILATETHDRGYYSGVCGLFDGKSLDSAVMIRFIEKRGNQLYYKSGGGITSFSKKDSEYQELINKIYVPIH
ncbi:MAG: aminodeoxychorismate synthase component I [Cyclobacteriaceae bacterium]